MLRGEITKGLDHDPNFRWRGQSVTRIENLSDIVFALALGMIISAAVTPQSYDELRDYLISIIPATAAFAVLIGIWHTHFTFFRRYGVADKKIIFFNAILLFVVLYLAYPLRFAFDSFFAFVMGLTGDLSRIERMRLNFSSSGNILGFFGLGFMVVHILYMLMHRHVLSKYTLLNLSEIEMKITRQSIFYHSGVALLAVIMGGLAYFTPLNGFAGFILAFTGLIPFLGQKKYPVPKAD
ncbi:TMEM175 family protein [Hellea balneolensis]|uniref:TMEM175 family protein n=1 Tax=Hellea balneolensis TaxID=287478 RepID=UPI00041027BB|nr:TMEM175 family protein [Hellea balneolensis]